MILSKRSLLLGMGTSIVTPAIIRADSLMKIKSINGWDPYILATRCKTQPKVDSEFRSIYGSGKYFNSLFNDNSGSLDETISKLVEATAQPNNLVLRHFEYKIMRVSQLDQFITKDKEEFL